MWRWCKRVVILLVPLLFVLAAVAFMLVRAEAMASLPVRSGALAVPGLSASASISRDALGVPRIRAATLVDACYAQGFVHAQDRFVQMDAMRRYASGRLAEVFGSSMVESDRRLRPHAFERRADAVLKRLPDHHRAMLASYTRGVNEGLRRLGAPPPEYALLRVTPHPWSERDTLLLQYAMWDMLAMNRGFELMLGTMRQALSEASVQFLTPEVSRFDVVDAGPGWVAPRLPGPGEVTIQPVGTDFPAPASSGLIPDEGARQAGGGAAVCESRPRVPWPRCVPADADPVFDAEEPFALGSNSFAVSAARSASGSAILANDMHLPLRVPAMWYRVSLSWTDGNDGAGRLEGFSLPGVPGIIVGGNGKVAWGFTNVEGDFEDWIVVEPLAENPERYKVPGGTEEFIRTVERIDVAGAPSQRIEIRQTVWGPVLRTDFRGRPLALRWIAHEDDHTNLALFDIFQTESLEEALDAASSWRGPPQNILIAAADGRIGWTMTGLVPIRTGFDGSAPTPWTDAKVGWSGWLKDADRPRVVDPPSGVIVTANNRLLPVEQSRVFGRAWASPVRAGRIAQLLAASPKHDERSLLAIQLDTRRETMEFYRELALDACRGDTTGEIKERARVESVLREWNGGADADQRGFALLKRFRARIQDAALRAFTDACVKLDPAFRYRWFNDEDPLRTLLETRPPHLLPRAEHGPIYQSWEALIRASLVEAVTDLVSSGPKRGLETTWGEVNRAAVVHPISEAAGRLPGVRRLLDMPAVPLSGDALSVRAQAPAFGASQRLVISPGREESAIGQLPGGQSGHFLSPHYRDQFDAWVRGDPAPLLPGPTVSTLTLTPAK